METIASILLESDCLRIPSLSFTLEGPSEIMGGPKSIGPLCVGKKIGGLDFRLSTKSDLKIDLPVDLQVFFAGSFVGHTPQGDLIVQFAVNQSFDNVSFYESGLNVDVNNAKGSILCLARLLVPREQGTSCADAQRSFGVYLETVPGNELQIGASVLGVDLNVFASDLTFTAKAGDTFAPIAKISPLLDNCGIGASKGNVQKFSASIQGSSPNSVSFRWDTTGSIIGADDAPIVSISIDNDYETVDLQIVADGVPISASYKYVAETDETWRGKNLRCRLQKFLLTNFRFNPLWDPLRDFVARPYSGEELVKLRGGALEIVQQIDDILLSIRSHNQPLPTRDKPSSSPGD